MFGRPCMSDVSASGSSALTSNFQTVNLGLISDSCLRFDKQAESVVFFFVSALSS